MHDLVVVEEKVGGILGEVEQAFFDIPFGNSEFQTTAFVIAAQQTPARAYRAIGLQMMSVINAVRAALLAQKKMEIDIEELEHKSTLDATSEFDKRRFRLDIIEKQSGAQWQQKLLNDSLRELDVLYREFKRHPGYTREEFEGQEGQHFDLRLKRQLQLGGPGESLANMNQDLPNMQKYLAAVEAALLEKKG
jgi:DNA-directed RNA polymerase subunit K/omega